MDARLDQLLITNVRSIRGTVKLYFLPNDFDMNRRPALRELIDISLEDCNGRNWLRPELHFILRLG
jgi:hypothetical protein